MLYCSEAQDFLTPGLVNIYGTVMSVVNDAFIRAVEANDINGVCSLLEAKADIEAAQRGETALTLATRLDHTEAVMMLVNAGGNVNAVGRLGNTPLMYATEYGRENLVLMLIGAGADINAANRFRSNPLALARKAGHRSIVAMLEDAQVSKDAAEAAAAAAAETARREAAATAQREADAKAKEQERQSEAERLARMKRDKAEAMAREKAEAVLLTTKRTVCGERDSNPLLVDRLYGQPTALLVTATQEADVITMRTLVEAGANVNALVNDWTCLMWASAGGLMQALDVLLEADANVNAVSRSGWTALMRASLNGHAAVVKRLIDADANLDIVSRHGETALTLARRQRHALVGAVLSDALLKEYLQANDPLQRNARLLDETSANESPHASPKAEPI